MKDHTEARSIDFVGILKLFWFVITHPIGSYRFATFISSWMKSNEFRDISKVKPA